MDMARRNTYKTLTDALRREIAGGDISFKRLERETGVSRQSLMRFVAGETSLRLDKADAVAEFFGLSITKRKGR